MKIYFSYHIKLLHLLKKKQEKGFNKFQNVVTHFPQWTREAKLYSLSNTDKFKYYLELQKFRFVVERSLCVRKVSNYFWWCTFSCQIPTGFLWCVQVVIADIWRDCFLHYIFRRIVDLVHLIRSINSFVAGWIWTRMSWKQISSLNHQIHQPASYLPG